MIRFVRDSGIYKKNMERELGAAEAALIAAGDAVLVATPDPRPVSREAVNWRIDPATQLPVGAQGLGGTSVGLPSVVQLSAAQIAAPTAAMLADLAATYQLNVFPFTRYVSNGTVLSKVGSEGGALALSSGIHTVVPGTQDILLQGGSVNLELDIQPSVDFAKLVIANAVASAVSQIVLAQRDQPALRFGSPTAEVVLPAITLDMSVGAEWTFMFLWRLQTETTQGAAIHTPVVTIGNGTYATELGYEGDSATARRCMKFVMANSVPNGQVAVRFGQSQAGSPVQASRQGTWGWMGVRRHAVNVTETLLNATGSAAAGNYTAGSISLFWAPLRAYPVAGNDVFGDPLALAASSTVTGNVRVRCGGAVAGDRGVHDVARVLFINKCATVDQIKQLAACRRPADIGMAVDNTKDMYYVLNSLTAAQMLDELGGTPAISAVVPEGLTPIANRPTDVRDPVGTVTTGELRVQIINGAVARVY